MADRFISDTATTYQLGQTVIAKVTNLDEEKRRFLVTLKVSEVISPAADLLTRLTNGLQERKAMAEMLSARGKNNHNMLFVSKIAHDTFNSSFRGCAWHLTIT